MNKELKRLSSLAKNNHLKLLPVMEVKEQFSELKEAHKNGAIIQFYSRFFKKFIDCKDNKPVWGKDEIYRVKPDDRSQN